MAEDRLYHDAALARFYDLDNGWTEDRSCCLKLAAGAACVLDLGCGTGDLAIRIAAVHGADVIGVDLAQAMLDLAAAMPGSDRVEWHRGDARDIDLGRSFDLIVMTGHTFQVFLADADRATCLRTIARHLAPGGRFIFDSRNPLMREWETWRPDQSRWRLTDPQFGVIEAWNDVDHDPSTGIVTYDTHYRVLADDRRFSARSRIGFPSHRQLAALIDGAGLTVDHWFGDWQGSPLAPDRPEIIPMGRLARRLSPGARP